MSSSASARPARAGQAAPPAPRAFATPAAFRAWLEKHHGSRRELIMRLFKVHAHRRGIGYKEALDEALCFGWIDGVRRSLDADSFTQRFTPRTARSNWSAVNVKRAHELVAEGRMHPAGLAAFEARDKSATAPYSFEHAPARLAPAFSRRLRANRAAWADWQRRSASYRRVATFWVMSAKKEETRLRRFQVLLDSAAKGEAIPLLR